MNISAIFIQRAIATSLLMFSLLLTGLFTLGLLPVASLPEIDYPIIEVLTFYPGASPEVMASSVTAVLEKQFGQMPGLANMTSTSSNGASVIILQFSLALSLDVAEQEVQAAINAAGSYLPPGLPNPPVYSKVNPADTPIITLSLSSKSLPLTQVEDYADTRLAPKIAELAGVGIVNITGGQKPAVRVQVNPDALAANGLGLEDIRAAIKAANVNAAKGSFDGPTLAYTINANDQLLSSADYKPIIIAYKNNSPLRLEDVAQVIDGAENVRQAAWVNREPAIILTIQRQPGANVIEVVDNIRLLLEKLRLTLPQAIDLQLLTDRTQTIRASVKEVQFELILAVVLVVLVIFLFLRNVAATFIPGISVPLSLIGSFGLMYLFGFSLNNLTLMALTIASGFVVDDAIVMIENISRYLEQGETATQAALKGAKQIGFTIIALSLSLVAVLIPLFFMEDIIGRLFREFALTLMITIFISTFVSLTLTPMLCARLLGKKGHESSTKAEGSGKNSLFDRVSQAYARSLSLVLKQQPLILIIAVLTLIASLSLFYFIPKDFFPRQDIGVIQGVSVMPESISFPAMAEKQQALNHAILEDEAVESLSSFIGIDGVNLTLNSGRILISLKPLSERSLSSTEIINRLQAKLAEIPGATLYMQSGQDLSIDTRVSPTQYQYSLSSVDAETLAKWGPLVLEEFKKLPELKDVASDQQDLGLETRLEIDRDTASRLGLSMQLIDDTLYDAFGQRQVSLIFTQRNQYRVVLEVLPQLQLDAKNLAHLYLNSATGGYIPFSSFSHVSQGVGPVAINRQNQFPAITLSFNLATGVSLGDATRAIEKIKANLNLPSGIQTSFEGTAKIFQGVLANEGFLLLAAILVVYIVLGVLYESYLHPLTILSSLPSACMGALLTLSLAGYTLSVIALIGIILLIGIVMKNAIMMIDFALEQERVWSKSARDAIYEACLLRFRPILMTTFASLIGAVPLALGTGMGEELRKPLGLGIIGGLIVSQLLTLYTIPVIYLTFDKLKKIVLREKDMKKPRSIGTEVGS